MGALNLQDMKMTEPEMTGKCRTMRMMDREGCEQRRVLTKVATVSYRTESLRKNCEGITKNVR